MRSLRLALSLVFLCAACHRGEKYKVGMLGAPDAPDAGAGDGMSSTDGPLFPQTGINATALTVTGAQPASGPFGGGNTIVVRGSGFTDDALVFIGGRMVQPADTVLQDRNSLEVVVPAGRSGSVSVEVRVGDQSAASDDAYVYNPIAIEPTSGSIAGGTSVLISTETARFGDADAQVEFDGKPCSELQVITPSQARCKSPPSASGAVDISISTPSAIDAPPLVASNAFEYRDLTDIDRGGLNGGPISGTVNVTVVDSVRGLAIPDAFVLINDTLAGPYQGRTDSRGQITFSGDDLKGRISVHVAAKCMERSSIISFDAANVTVHVAPIADPSCADLGAGSSAPGRGTAGSFISGELVFGGTQEFSSLAWDAVPRPRSNEVRVAYVFTTRSSPQVANPTPSLSGTLARVLEATPVLGDRGYLYRIFARPAMLAVYAIAGVERRDTGEFVPYVMGVTPGVLTSPGEEEEGVDIQMNIPLDRDLQVELSQLPHPAGRSPKYFRMRTYLDLGAEGALVRQINGRSLDTLTSFEPGKPFRFFAQPALVGPLADARYGIIAGWYSGEDEEQAPYTELRRTGVDAIDGRVAVTDLLALPEAVAPSFGAQIPEDRVLRWSIDGQAPDLFVISITGGDGLPAWTQIVPGHQTFSSIPDFSSITGLTDITAGAIYWEVRAVRIEGFVYDEFKYSLLHPRLWSHTSLDEFTMRR